MGYIKSQFVTREIASAVEELGFNEPCIAFFNTESEDSLCFVDLFGFISELGDDSYIRNSDSDKLTAPTWQDIVDWFREKNEIIVNVYANASGYLFEMHDSAKIGGTHRYDSGFDGPNEGGCWDDYYEARKAAILKEIEIIKKNNDGTN